MKKFFAIVIALFVAFQASGQIIPEIKIGDASLKISGYTQAQVVAADGIYHEWDATWSNFRINLDLNWDKVELFTQLNLVTTEDGGLEDNWLRVAYARYRINERWSVLAGRIFTSGGYSTPTPYDLRTVQYPSSMTFDCYAWGGQIRGKITDTVSISADITGKSGTAFDADDIFTRTEFGFSLKKEFGDPKKPGYGYIAGYGQFYGRPSGLQRYGASSYWHPTEQITILGGLCYTRYATDRQSDEIGGYVLVAYKPIPWLELHGQIDWTKDIQKTYHEVEISKDETGQLQADYVEYNTSDAESKVLTLGVKLMETHDAFSVTIDREIPIDDNTREPRWLAKVQVKF